MYRQNDCSPSLAFDIRRCAEKRLNAENEIKLSTDDEQKNTMKRK